MRLDRGIPFLLLLALALGGPALAEEIVYFTNGTSMPIRGHQVKDGMVHVDLGSNNFIAFPEENVERIEAAGREVYLKPSYSGANVTAGKLVSGPNDGNFPVSAESQVSSRDQRRRRGEQSPEYDPNAKRGGRMPTREGLHGIETGFPLANHPNKAARKLGVTGPALSAPGDPRMKGAQRRGNKWVMNGTTSPQERRGTSTPTRIGLRTEPPQADADTEGAGASDDGAASGGAASGAEGDGDG